MTTITCDQLPALFEGVAAIFAEKREELCDMDANMGDGDAGKTLMKAGMKMSSVVPSTMGTLMSSGIMEGGKALKGKAELGPAELSVYLTAFAAGIQKRGKCQPGDRTILDAVSPAAEAAEKAAEAGGDLSAVIAAACEGAAKAAGVADQGAVAGLYMLQGLQRGLAAL